jgi:hypothetical protein
MPTGNRHPSHLDHYLWARLTTELEAVRIAEVEHDVQDHRADLYPPVDEGRP